jgi:hypothetical protein|tara:strand:+ start:743 stop:928 length:186 start_codon:yes stop_codon:yes gene_type:complete
MPRKGPVINRRTLTTSPFSTRKMRPKKMRLEMSHLRKSPQEAKRNKIKIMDRKGILLAQAW